MPEHLIGQVVAVRVAALRVVGRTEHKKELRIYSNNQLVAQHRRNFKKKQWVRDLSHYEKTLEYKPKARVMAYREKLLGLDEKTAAYVGEICRRDRNSMNQQILKLYALWQEHGTSRFLEAVGFCLKEQVYGTEYVELMLRIESEGESDIQIDLKGQPIQSEIDRDLAVYDKYTYR